MAHKTQNKSAKRRKAARKRCHMCGYIVCRRYTTCPKGRKKIRRKRTINKAVPKARAKLRKPRAKLRKRAPRILYWLRVNGAGAFQMTNPNSRQRHWKPLSRTV
jgi:hypothetical protein